MQHVKFWNPAKWEEQKSPYIPSSLYGVESSLLSVVERIARMGDEDTVLYVASLTHLHRGERIIDLIRALKVLPADCSIVGFNGESIWQLLDKYGEENRQYCFQRKIHEGKKVGRPLSTASLTKMELERQIALHGSLDKAAKRMGLSYYAVKRAAHRLGVQLGPPAHEMKHMAKLSVAAKKLLRLEKMQRRVEEAGKKASELDG